MKLTGTALFAALSGAAGPVNTKPPKPGAKGTAGKRPVTRKSMRCVCINKSFALTDKAYARESGLDTTLWATAAKRPRIGPYETWMTEALPYMFAGLSPPEIPSPSGDYGIALTYPGRWLRPASCSKPDPSLSLRGTFRVSMVKLTPDFYTLKLFTNLVTPLTRRTFELKGRVRAVYDYGYRYWWFDQPFDILSKGLWHSRPFSIPPIIDISTRVYIQFDDDWHTQTWETFLDAECDYPVHWPMKPFYAAHRDTKPRTFKLGKKTICHVPKHWTLTFDLQQLIGQTRNIRLIPTAVPFPVKGKDSWTERILWVIGQKEPPFKYKTFTTYDIWSNLAVRDTDGNDSPGFASIHQLHRGDKPAYAHPYYYQYHRRPIILPHDPSKPLPFNYPYLSQQIGPVYFLISAYNDLSIFATSFNGPTTRTHPITIDALPDPVEPPPAP